MKKSNQRAQGGAGGRLLLGELRSLADAAQAAVLSRFFKTGPGEYGEGDVFLGLKVPQVRAVLAQHPVISIATAGELLESEYHEARLLGVLALVRAHVKSTAAAEREEIFRFYLSKAHRANNWDLVDLSAPELVGGHLPPGKGRGVLRRLAKSACLWERRIAMVGTYGHIRQGELSNTFWLAEMLLGDREDLMHKAVGWMLREAGKRDEPALEEFLGRHAPRMPRTALRYAIERLPEGRRRHWMAVPSEVARIAARRRSRRGLE